MPRSGGWRFTGVMGDELANDRTFLAWLRTGIALFGLGFVVAKVALIVQPDASGTSDKGLYTTAGVVVVLCGAGLIVVGYLQHVMVARLLRQRGDGVGTRPRWPLTITTTALAGSLLLSGLLVVST